MTTVAPVAETDPSNTTSDSSCSKLEVKEIGDTYEAKFTWTVKNVSKLKGRVYSPEFYIGNSPWRILFFPRGNAGPQHVSMFLDVANAEKLPAGWARYTQFKLKVVNLKDDRKSLERTETFEFYAHKRDYGYNKFMNASEIYDKNNGFFNDNTVVLEVALRTFKDYVCGRYIDWSTYDSRKETGYVGLVNLGATCYLNALIQSLFHTPAFRRAVYKMPIGTVDQSGKKSIPLALQRLFYSLATDPSGVSTQELIRSFGWSQVDAVTQQDVQELNRVLMDKLESKMKGSEVEEEIPRLFKGTIESYISCVNVDYTSSREEQFYDLQLQIHGNKNIYESFDQYTAQELLDGDNQYRAEGHGLQDAQKGSRFLKFPPVLQLQLLRFKYDFYRNMNVKINDRWEFPDTLDLSKYLAANAPDQPAPIYHLHSVIVQSGSAQAGHYYAFIRPTSENKWFKFDDTHVAPVSPKVAIDENYGGEYGFANSKTWGTLWGSAPTSTRRHMRVNSGYMLVYIRESDQPEILAPVERSEIPRAIASQMDKERQEAEIAAKRAARAHLFQDLSVCYDTLLQAHSGFELIRNSKCETFRIHNEGCLLDLKRSFAARHGVPPENQRIWYFVSRKNNTHRPQGVYNDEILYRPIKNLFESRPPRIFIEILEGSPRTTTPAATEVDEDEREPLTPTEINSFPSESPDFTPVTKGDCLLFLKEYLPAEDAMKFRKSIILSNQSSIGSIIPIIRKSFNWPESTEVAIAEEVTADYINEYDDLSVTLDTLDIRTGDIICFNKVLKNQSEFARPTIKSYWKYLANRVFVTFADRYNPEAVNFVVKLDQQMNYQQMAEAFILGYQKFIIEKTKTTTVESSSTEETATTDSVNTPNNFLDTLPDENSLDPFKFLFYHSTVIEADDFSRPAHFSPKKLNTVAQMLTSLYYQRTNRFYFEPIDYSLNDLETNEIYNVIWHGSAVSEKSIPKTLNCLVNKISPTNLSLYEQVWSKIGKNEDGSNKKIWIFTVRDNTVCYLINPRDTPLRCSQASDTLHAVEEVAQPPKCNLIPVCHCSTSDSQYSLTFGTPFIFSTIPSEPLSETSKRLQEYLGVSDTEWKKYKIGYYLAHSFHAIEEDAVIHDIQFGIEKPLALCHPKPASYNSYGSRQLKIDG